MSTGKIKIIFTIFSIIWVGGWGYLMFRFPGFFARVNSRLGFKMMSGPKFTKFTRRLGIVEMALAAISAINALAMSAFGFKWY